MQRAFAADLDLLQKRLGLTLDVVCISGGLTETGSPDAYYELHQFVERALRPLLGSVPIFAVPGPSDATRIDRSSFGLLALRNWFAQKELSAAFFQSGSAEGRRDILQAFKPYNDWADGIRQATGDWKYQGNPVMPGDFWAQAPTLGMQLVGLNSAWLQPAYQDAPFGPGGPPEPSFDLHPSQLQALFGRDTPQGPSLLLTYHGPQGLHPTARDAYYAAINPSSRRFLVHMCATPMGEAPRLEILRSGRTTDGIVIQGRGLCDPQAHGDPILGFNLGRMVPDGRGHRISLWPRRYHVRRSAFVADQDYEELDGDKIEVNLGLSLDPVAWSQPGTSPPGLGSILVTGNGNVVTVHQRTAPSAAGGKPSRISVRRLMQAILRTDSDFMAFLLDFFPDVYRRMSGGMDATAKFNLLLQLIDTPTIVEALQRCEPRAFERERKLLDYE